MPHNRLTQSALSSLKAGVIALAHRFGPIGVRGLYYQAVVAGLVEKTERDYDRVQRMVKEARLGGELPWELITDESRRCIQVPTFADVGELMQAARDSFRLDPWITQPCRLHVWVEKEGLAPVFAEVTRRYRVPLYPGKGYASLSFSRTAARSAMAALNDGQAVCVLQWGDYDPSGVGISESLAEHYRLHGAANAEIVRVGIKPEHIGLWSLPTRPTKSTDSRARGFGDNRSVELDAVPPAQLKTWVEQEIQARIGWALWQAAMATEAAEREKLDAFVAGATN